MNLQKGCGYHLDLFILCILVAIASVMGLPWFVAATVLAMTHVNSLKVESQTSAPGEKPQFLGVLEQRVTNIIIFLLCGLSVFFTPLLKHIPMPVLFGVFLYMGTSSLKGSQVIKWFEIQNTTEFSFPFFASFSNVSSSYLCHKNTNQIIYSYDMFQHGKCIYSL